MYVAYDGSAYHGWQSQPNGTSVQEVVEKSLSTLLRCPIGVTAAGRTDAGVNATNMPVHFDYNGVLPVPSSAPCGTTAEQQASLQDEPYFAARHICEQNCESSRRHPRTFFGREAYILLLCGLEEKSFPRKISFAAHISRRLWGNERSRSHVTRHARL